MKIAIIYKSLTRNTERIAQAIRESLGDEVIYCGDPKQDIEADFYFIGSWTDKGMCCAEITDYLKTLNNKKIAYFATAGFGGSEEYYRNLAERVKSVIPLSTEMTASFFCQGKMPMSVRNRYVAMMTEHPDDKKLEVSIQNFDKALEHPNTEDLENAKRWAKDIYQSIAKNNN